VNANKGRVKLAARPVQLAVEQIIGQSERGGKGETCGKTARGSGARRRLLLTASVGCREADVSSIRRGWRDENCIEVLDK
jgi:hypothetical protein